MIKKIEQTMFHVADGELMEAKKYTPPIYDSIHTVPIRVGVVGYSSKKFDTEKAEFLLFLAFQNVKHTFETTLQKTIKIELVSGLTDVGVPALAYRGAISIFGPTTRTVGIACAKAKDFPQFPVDEKHIIGDNWGDESDYFLDNIDCLIRIGGGDQSMKEVETFKQRYPEKLVLEYNL